MINKQSLSAPSHQLNCSAVAVYQRLFWQMTAFNNYDNMTKFIYSESNFFPP